MAFRVLLPSITAEAALAALAAEDGLSTLYEMIAADGARQCVAFGWIQYKGPRHDGEKIFGISWDPGAGGCFDDLTLRRGMRTSASLDGESYFDPVSNDISFIQVNKLRPWCLGISLMEAILQRYGLPKIPLMKSSVASCLIRRAFVAVPNHIVTHVMPADWPLEVISTAVTSLDLSYNRGLYDWDDVYLMSQCFPQLDELNLSGCYALIHPLARTTFRPDVTHKIKRLHLRDISLEWTGTNLAQAATTGRYVQGTPDRSEAHRLEILIEVLDTFPLEFVDLCDTVTTTAQLSKLLAHLPRNGCVSLSLEQVDLHELLTACTPVTLNLMNTKLNLTGLTQLEVASQPQLTALAAPDALLSLRELAALSRACPNLESLRVKYPQTLQENQHRASHLGGTTGVQLSSKVTASLKTAASALLNLAAPRKKEPTPALSVRIVAPEMQGEDENGGSEVSFCDTDEWKTMRYMCLCLCPNLKKLNGTYVVEREEAELYYLYLWRNRVLDSPMLCGAVEQTLLRQIAEDIVNARGLDEYHLQQVPLRGKECGALAQQEWTWVDPTTNEHHRVLDDCRMPLMNQVGLQDCNFTVVIPPTVMMGPGFDAAAMEEPVNSSNYLDGRRMEPVSFLLKLCRDTATVWQMKVRIAAYMRRQYAALADVRELQLRYLPDEQEEDVQKLCQMLYSSCGFKRQPITANSLDSQVQRETDALAYVEGADIGEQPPPGETDWDRLRRLERRLQIKKEDAGGTVILHPNSALLDNYFTGERGVVFVWYPKYFPAI